VTPEQRLARIDALIAVAHFGAGGLMLGCRLCGCVIGDLATHRLFHMRHLQAAHSEIPIEYLTADDFEAAQAAYEAVQ
jgi:hypothetical protein